MLRHILENECCELMQALQCLLIVTFLHLLAFPCISCVVYVTFGRGKVYWGTDFQKHIVGGVSDLQRIDETRFSVSAKEGLRFATLESFQLLRWDTHPEAKRAKLKIISY